MYNPQLETFLCVAECGSFNKAAEKLFISPPAVIKQINLLEENLDLQLFVRTHRGLQLTEAGKSLAQDAKYIIQYCKDSVTRAKNVMKKSEDINVLSQIGQNLPGVLGCIVEWHQLEFNSWTLLLQFWPQIHQNLSWCHG